MCNTVFVAVEILFFMRQNFACIEKLRQTSYELLYKHAFMPELTSQSAFFPLTNRRMSREYSEHNWTGIKHNL